MDKRLRNRHDTFLENAFSTNRDRCHAPLVRLIRFGSAKALLHPSPRILLLGSDISDRIRDQGS